ncbi:MafI family immunity protein [Pseudomonas sp. Sample_11]|uniref:MafI family immunity protein n=1 Tax=Pseudomonas sp. Sample_11 TaxID=2448261 RepID=UPI001032DF05|nr:MafI family immunity protein [Pseudomonas sp. Sample_11]
MFAAHILKFGEKFQGRLDSDLLQGALNYVAYNEEGLAFEILCDHIAEYDVLISEEEYLEALRLISALGFDVNVGPFKHLIGLKR